MEENKKKWLTVLTARDALIKKYDNSSLMRMPTTGKYAGYTYFLFNDRIRDGYQTTDIQSDSRELAYSLRIGEKETVLIKNLDEDKEVELSAQEFMELVGDKTSKDYKAIREPLKEVSKERYKRGRSDHTKYAGTKMQHQIDREQENFLFLDQEYRRKRDVWEVSTNNYKADEHFAMYPEKLIEPCILAGSEKGGVVLDPFFGSGTTGAVAKRLGRRYIGIDLNPKFCEIARQRIEKVVEE